MLAVPFTAIQLQDEEEDSEASPVTVAVNAGKYVAKHWKQIANFLSGVFLGWEVYDLTHPDPSASVDEDNLRKEEARLLARSLSDGTTQYANALNRRDKVTAEGDSLPSIG